MRTETLTTLHFDDARHYDRLYRDRKADVDFYRRTCTEIGPTVLEVGCGTGRITSALLAAGLNVIGVEPTPHMAQAFLQKGLPPEALVQCDFESFQSAQRFDCVIAPFNVLGHFATSSLPAVLRKIHSLLKPGGSLVLDVANPLAVATSREWRKFTSYADPDSEHGIQVDIRSRYCAESLGKIPTIEVEFKYHVPTRQTEYLESLTLAAILPTALDKGLADAGFQMLRKEAGFSGQPFDSTSALQVVVAIASAAK